MDRAATICQCKFCCMCVLALMQSTTRRADELRHSDIILPLDRTLKVEHTARSVLTPLPATLYDVLVKLYTRLSSTWKHSSWHFGLCEKPESSRGKAEMPFQSHSCIQRDAKHLGELGKEPCRLASLMDTRNQSGQCGNVKRGPSSFASKGCRLLWGLISTHQARAASARRSA